LLHMCTLPEPNLDITACNPCQKESASAVPCTREQQKQLRMQDNFAAHCLCYTDQELARVHVIHRAKNPTSFVNIHHGHFTIPHGPCIPILTRQQVLVWQGKPACNVHTLLSTQKHGSMTKALKTTSILLQMCEWSIDLLLTYLNNSAVLLLPQAHC